VQRETALLVDDVVPHPQAALLRLAEVVGVQDARHVPVEIHGDETIVRIAEGSETRCIEHLHIRLLIVVAGEVELLLHAGDVRVALLYHEASAGAELGVVPDPAVDLDHVVVGDVLVLSPRDLFEVRSRHRLPAGGTVDDERAAGAPGQDLGLDVHIAELGGPALGHLFREAAELCRCRVDEDVCHSGLLHRWVSRTGGMGGRNHRV
jgi:hypothetical protein